MSARPRVLFLDDDPERHAAFARECTGGLVSVYSHAEAIRALHEAVFDVAFLDCDLGDFSGGKFSGYCENPETTGEDTARYIAALSPERRPRLVVVHSWNAPGARRMADTLIDSGITVRLCAFRVGLWSLMAKEIAEVAQ